MLGNQLNKANNPFFLCMDSVVTHILVKTIFFWKKFIICLLVNIFCYFPQPSCYKSFRSMGVGGEGKAPQDFKIWYFPNKFFAKKVVYLVSSGENEILSLLPPLQKYFWPTPGHKRRSRQIFGCAKDFCPKSSKLSRKVLCDFCQQIFSPFLVWPPKMNSCVFLQTLGTIFWSQTTLCVIFARIFRDFARISINQNFSGWAFTPCTPAYYTTAPGKSTFGPCLKKILPAPIFRVYMLIYRMLKGTWPKKVWQPLI